MKIAIIGGSGFIGTYTYIALRNIGIQDITIIDIKKPYRECVLGLNPRYISCDITDQTNIDALLKKEKFEIIYMLAGIIRADEVRRNILTSYDININGLVNVLNAIKDQDNLNKFIYPSTTHVYHKTTDTIDINTPIVNDEMHLYPGGKFCAETIIKGFNLLYGVPYVILRYSVAYGLYGHPDNVVSTFIAQAKSGADLNVHHSGEGMRDLLYVTDHANGNVLVAMEPSVLNVTIILGGYCISIERLAKKIITYTKSKSKLNILDYKRPGDHSGFSNIDISVAKELLNWNPLVTIDQGLEIMLNHDQ